MLQFVLMAAIVVLGVVGPGWPDSSALVAQGRRRASSFLAGALVVCVGRHARSVPSFTPFPQPGGRRAARRATGRTRSSATPSTRAGSSSSRGISLALSPWALVGTAVLAVVWALKARVEERFLARALPGIRGLLRADALPPRPLSSTDVREVGCRAWSAAWPEPVERVSSFLRESGVEARIQEFPDGTPTAAGRGRRRRLRARPDREVARLRLRRAAGRRARPGRPPRRPGQGRPRRSTRARHASRRRRRSRTRPASRRAPSRRSRSRRSTTVLIDRALYQPPLVWVGAGSARHMLGAQPDRARRGSPRARPMDVVAGPNLRFFETEGELTPMHETEKIWMNGELVDWADAKIHVGVARAALRLRRVRGHPLLRHAEGPGRLPARPTTSSASRTRRSSSTWSCRTRSRSSAPPRTSSIARQRARGVLPPADRVLRLRRARRLHGREPGRRRDHELAVGRVPRRGQPDARASRRRSRPGSASGPNDDPARRQGDGHLPELDARDDRGAPRRLRRGDPAHRTTATSPTARARTSSSSRTASSTRRRSRRRSCPGSRATRSSRSPRTSATASRRRCSSAPTSTSPTRCSWPGRRPR